MVTAAWGRLRLTDLLGAVGAFSGRVPSPPARASGLVVSDDVAAALAELPERVQDGVLDPLGRGREPGATGRPLPLYLPSLTGRTVRARQVDATTCGSAVVAMLALAGDPSLTLRLARSGDPGRAFAALQRYVKRATNRTVGGIPVWPDALGTPPWGAARVARYGPVRFTHRVVSEPQRSSAGRGPTVWDAVVEAARAGMPVPLFTGGDVGHGFRTAVPRHVVLLTAVGPGRGDARDGHADREEMARVYEPSSGAVHTVPFGVLRDGPAGHADPATGTARLAALGGWPHVTWALLPSDRR